MSTRSGKRIHSSFENIQEPDMNNVKLKSGRKTRSKRRKDDTEDSNAVLNETAHYVHYPGDEALKDNLEKSSRKLRRHTLKEHNTNVTNKQNSDNNVDSDKPRHTRKTKKIVQDSESFSHTWLFSAENKQVCEKEAIELLKKVKKIKKIKKKNIIVETIEKIEEDIKENVPKGNKKSKKKKHLKRSGELEVKDFPDNSKNNPINESGASIDSFHSAAGSPEYVKPNGILSKLTEDTSSDKYNSDILQKSSRKCVTLKVFKRSSTLPTSKNSDDDSKNINKIVDKGSTAKRKLSRNRKSTDLTVVLIEPTDIDCPAKNVRAMIMHNSLDSSNTKINLTFEKLNQDSNTTDEKLEQPNGTFDKSHTKLNNTFEKSDQKLNETFEKLSNNGSDFKYENIGEVPEKSSSKRKSLITTNDESQTKQTLNSTFEKSPNNSKSNKTKSLDTTFDKESDECLPINEEVPTTNGKSNSINTTFDKSLNHSHISINSDDSNMENIINATPQLVESSIEESGVHSSPKPLTRQSSAEKRKEVPITPLKREGTYTKDSPKVETPKSQPATPKSKETRLSMIETPNRRKSLQSPGHTPILMSKTSGNKNKALNITHSIEKSLIRTSIAETVPKMTKVMFCSPINDPVIGSQIKRKVIKSNLKGSNKSFVFDESMSETRRSVGRKRSYTQSEADTTQSKRSRIGEEMQQSIDRLSRPRTISASAKLSEPSTPSKKIPTEARPDPKVSRTKLPNFAALHQKRFEKMESLDECQERKAKRARQLLTPTCSVNLLERISPKEKVAESPKSSNAKKPKKHTLESLNPGYTRFGFRMNYEDNPFINKNQTEVKKDRPNGLKRQATLPSLSGTISLRREAAKLTVMREKSFTEKRDTKRKENRTIIKGVRTNRRFELQMKMRNINA